jgi:tRNA threonylcarbamoyladenosine biosynthesis protein TsaE
MEIIYNLSDIYAVARSILSSNPNKIILFNGAMGAGKTTLIKVLCSELGVLEPTSSPTFSIVNEYQAAVGLIYHFDVYRLKNEVEASDMGIEDYLYSGNWCFIEWSEKIPNLIPDVHSIVNIQTLSSGTRLLTMK